MAWPRSAIVEPHDLTYNLGVQALLRISPCPFIRLLIRRYTMLRRYLLWSLLNVLIFTVAACSPAPATLQPTAPAATAGVPIEQSTQTLPAAAPTNTPAPVIPTETATSIPSIPTETLPPTATPSATPRPRGTAATPRPRNTVAPLAVSYQVVEIKRAPGDVATLVLKVMTTGGSGPYRYYHDDILQASDTFNVAGTCGKPFVHTIKVISSDRQTVAVPYHVNGICPTPTP